MITTGEWDRRDVSSSNLLYLQCYNKVLYKVNSIRLVSFLTSLVSQPFKLSPKSYTFDLLEKP